MITKTCKVVPRIIMKVRLDFLDDISIRWHPLLDGSQRHLCTSQTEDRHTPYSGKNLAQTKKEEGWCYDPTIKYEALRQCAVPRYAYYDDSATDGTNSSDSEIEIETMTEEEAQIQKDKILAEAKEEQPFPYYPTINYEILKQFYYLDSPDSLAYSNLILASDPKEELESKLDKFHSEATFTQLYRIDSKTDDTETEPETKTKTEPETETKTEPETETKTEPETETETKPDSETGSELKAHKDKIHVRAKDEHLFSYNPRIKYKPLKRYIVPRFAFYDSSSTDWSDSSSFSDSESEKETMEKIEAQSREHKILAGSEEKQILRENLVKPPSTDLQDFANSPSVNHGAKSPAKVGDNLLKQAKEMDSYTEDRESSI
ncbi:hypothetical protein POM88_051192 [Heracleum sosnowskyi]|uniref:Uncharacterized protein n=1 Tax=Heracleum sosnowskyi TaxID=360622 RepID=A0AAD8H029_9APIA|nr:hypothetical protein POM88_051192 [Heracleum sosnowskyi]